MAIASVTLEYQGRLYQFDGDDETLLRGRLACDCEKSQLIRAACDSHFPELKCGAEIAVVSVHEAGEEKKAAGRENRPRWRQATTGK